jgi:hypothetical protein
MARLSLLASDFEKKNSNLINSDTGINFLGLKHIAQFHTQAGVSSLTSWMAFHDEQDAETLCDIPDYILSDTLEKDLNTTINVCARALAGTKYFPKDVKAGESFGAVAEGQREGAYLEAWEDFQIVGFDGLPIYTEATLSDAEDAEQDRLATALWLIVKDICDEGRMLSPDWYLARILFEFFREYPVPPENAFLIGELYKELCVKKAYEGELSTYYRSLTESQQRRQLGASATQKKAEELRDFCVGLFVDLAVSVGPMIMFAPPEIQAHELRKVALEARPDSFVRSGKPYSVEWFLRSVIEDRRLDIIKALERIQAQK